MFSKVRSRFRSRLENEPSSLHEEPVHISAEDKNVAENTRDVSESLSDVPDPEVQNGVRNAEAITLTWTKPFLITVFASIWLVYFANAFQSSITSNLTPFVLSDFAAHSLVPTIYIVSNVMAGSLRLAVSRLLDLWGRPQGFAVALCVATLGLILMAKTTNVETFAAAQVFYTVGFDALIYSCDVVTADVTSLKNRALAYAFTSSPYIITAFAGPKAAEGFYEKISWQWAFGIFCIILPVVAAPLFITLMLWQQKAKKSGLLTPRNSGRKWNQSIWFYIVDVDAFGVFLFAAGFCLFLLPFSIAGDAVDQWKTPHIIAMLVLGFVLLIAFVLYEKFLAPKPFLPFSILLHRSVLGTCMLTLAFQVGYYCWSGYFTSYLQVVHNLGISEAGYVGSVFDVVSGIWTFFIGYLVRKTGHFKWIMIIAVPMDILGIGLMIYFRQPGWSVGYVVMCQIFIAISGGTLILTQQISIMSVVEHEQFAAVLALLGLFGYIGGAIGNSISGAVWTNTFPEALAKNLPDYAQANLTDIYNDLDTQLSYPMGDPVRDAIITSYAVAQKYMCTAGVCIMATSLIWVFMIKDVNVNRVKQTKGLVF
ncbi:MFS general substrate transporter [Microthyrium microscopicum]|uniref:MFS general substrate transporter n=1 Tax=Microthyrium microscopicum TaxID=703497 RepID=A0A6A6U841_9PEZI|nr:MFS general substrate transporter [Microthyrium microscopicum]